VASDYLTTATGKRPCHRCIQGCWPTTTIVEFVRHVTSAHRAKTKTSRVETVLLLFKNRPLTSLSVSPSLRPRNHIVVVPITSAATSTLLHRITRRRFRNHVLSPRPTFLSTVVFTLRTKRPLSFKTRLVKPRLRVSIQYCVGEFITGPLAQPCAVWSSGNSSRVMATSKANRRRCTCCRARSVRTKWPPTVKGWRVRWIDTFVRTRRARQRPSTTPRCGTRRYVANRSLASRSLCRMATLAFYAASPVIKSTRPIPQTWWPTKSLNSWCTGTGIVSRHVKIRCLPHSTGSVCLKPSWSTTTDLSCHYNYYYFCFMKTLSYISYTFLNIANYIT